MVARNVSVHLKSNSLHEFGHVFETQVLPLLRKQKGFRDEITIASSNGLDVTAISLWENQADAEAYNISTYPEVVKTFSRLTDGAPRVHSCDVVSSTYHKVVAAAPVPA